MLVGLGKERGKASLAHQSRLLRCKGGGQAITSAEQGELHLGTGEPEALPAAGPWRCLPSLAACLLSTPFPEAAAFGCLAGASSPASLGQGCERQPVGRSVSTIPWQPWQPGDGHSGLGSSSARLDKLQLAAPWRQSRAPRSCSCCFCPGLAQILWPFPLLLFFPVECGSPPAPSFPQEALWLWVLLNTHVCVAEAERRQCPVGLEMSVYCNR